MKPLIEIDIVARHSLGGETPLELCPYSCAVEAHRAPNGYDRLFECVNNEACDVFLDDLWNRSATIGDYRGAAGHCFDHDQAKWLRPFDGKQQGSGASQETCLV